MVRCVALLTPLDMLVAATGCDTAMTVVRGYDVEDILLGDTSAADFTENKESRLARKLVEDDVLLPFFCSCSFVYRVNTDHRLVKGALLMDADSEQKTVEEGSPDGSGHCRGHSLWQHENAFQELLALFDRLLHVDGEKGMSGTECVQALLQLGAHSIPTAIALANELLHHGLIVECYSSNDSNSGGPFQMKTAARYKRAYTKSTNGVADHGDKKCGAIVSSERAGRLMKDRCELEAKVHQLKESYLCLFLVFCFCCVLMLLDALVTTVSLPGPLKLSLVTGLLLWLTRSGGSAPLSFNFQSRNHKKEFNKVSQEIDERRRKFLSQLNSTPHSTLADSQNVLTSFPITVKERRESAAAVMMRDEAMDRTVIVLSRAEKAEVYLFRLAIAQAGTMPVEATHVFSDEYLFSVLRVKNRALAYAVTKMAHIIEWRRMYKVDTIRWDDVKS